ncbi:DUF5906 domain-containing protein [Sinorhizobium meliloti]|uniref:DUF5906 domain-containing protein n=1 Tax=Rhizobium meliloti TaxID=382 RepID=UPI0001E4B033|nr:bifunctional DNA primase/polymerase [Sinorhizobium meliloti]AEG53177.1 Primase 2 [Sinorhizobium meliloti AK83]MDE4591107.1 bifunctional DNA primase/polymerase [Sinorhizobium meliloti]SEI56617.1 Primase C terminal 2 (PriCT-2) [Sinorhizobium meliloti]
MLDQIERLARAGFAIHWLHPKQKRPIGENWSTKPVLTLEQLKKTYKDGNNVGVRLGKWSKIGNDYLHVIDLDIRDPKLADEARQKLTELFPVWKTYPTVISGSGGESRHFYILSDKPFSPKKLAHSREKIQTADGKWHWRWEIDLFGTGKQVAMPPSIHPDTGKPYRWQTPFDFDDLDLGLGPMVGSDVLAKMLDMDADDERAAADPERSKPLGLSLDEIREVLDDLPRDYWRDDRDGWLTVGMSLHHETGGSDHGYKLWLDFSKDSEKFDKSDQKRVWKSFKGSQKPVRMATLVTAAREARLDEEFENLDDDVTDDLDAPEQDTEFDDILGTEHGDTKRAKKLKKSETEADLGHVPPKVRRMNRKHAVAFVNGKTVIVTEHMDGTTAYGTPNELHNWYENDRVATEKATEPVSKAWMRHKLRRQYPNGIVFAPGQERDGYFNHWKGFAVEPDSEGSCRLILDHLKNVICSGNEEYYRYALGWFAHMIQRPFEKPGVAMVLRGKKRIGKDTIADYIGGLFPHHHVVIANQEQLVGKFNAHQEKCLLLHVQEGFWAGNKNAEGSLKYLITSEKVFIEPKGLNGFHVDSYLRLFMSSNEDWVVPATADEGRYFVLDVSPHRKDDHGYFRAIRNERDHGGQAALLHYLQNYDLSDFEVRKVPDTTALAQQKVQGLKNIDKWWFDMLESGELEFPCYSIKGGNAGQWLTEPVMVDRDEFRQAYSEWMRRQRYNGEELVKFMIGKRMREILPQIEDRRRREGAKQVWTYVFPKLSECRRAFERYMNSHLVWEDISQPVDDIEDDYDDLDDL